jgi:hypothetical protein
MNRVIIISPYSVDTIGKIESHKSYARDCMIDSFKKGESPIVFHLLYTQVLADNVPKSREKGMEAAYEWYSSANYVVVYTDYGISKGMKEDIKQAGLHNLLIKERSLYV